jgi:hypothetical protein
MSAIHENQKVPKVEFTPKWNEKFFEPKKTVQGSQG